MRIISYGVSDSLEYPVGKNIQDYVEFTDKASIPLNKELKKLRDGTKDRGSLVNLWCRGSSGAIISALFIPKIDPSFEVRIVHVKKSGEVSHSPEAECFTTAIDVIVDDFVVSGETVNAIHESKNNNTDSKKIDIVVLGAFNQRWYLKFKPSVIITEENSIKDYSSNWKTTKV